MISAVKVHSQRPRSSSRAKLCGNDHFWGGEHVQSNHSHYFRYFEVGIVLCKKLGAYSSSDRDVPGILQHPWRNDANHRWLDRVSRAEIQFHVYFAVSSKASLELCQVFSECICICCVFYKVFHFHPPTAHVIVWR